MARIPANLLEPLHDSPGPRSPPFACFPSSLPLLPSPAAPSTSPPLSHPTRGRRRETFPQIGAPTFLGWSLGSRSRSSRPLRGLRPMEEEEEKEQ